ncbi:MAG: zinc dependent phospholipase C family protein [Thermodesulfobacteriota bacterium]
MLIAHLVPGHFAAAWSQGYWNPQWTHRQRLGLWIAAYGSTVAPDLDVIYNCVFRGFFGHTTLWTHSLFPYLGLVLAWWVTGGSDRWRYAHTMIGLVAVGGLSHLALDVVSHSTPLFYPLSMYMVGAPSTRVLEGKLLGYLTDPILLLEPALITLAAAHRMLHQREASRALKTMGVFSLVGVLAAISAAYLSLLPTLREMAGTEAF